ncbi:MAG: hypothetical protein FIA93_04185 [Deltaproteobacteria bacterium]|nr:hypothetical protein [Deltaproteobacteria bacterium]PWB67165.1 MAG: hypothetical protein C3F14_02820 [Deltaproteobacteria bacterium]
MAEPPPHSPENGQFTSCPYCTIQIPADAKVCPYCQQVLNFPGKIGPQDAAPVESEFVKRFQQNRRLSPLFDLWSRYGKWIKIAGPVLAAAILLSIVYGLFVGVKVRIAPNASLPLKATHERKGQTALFRVLVTNEGEDVPDLSLKSIAVVAEFSYRDGTRTKKTMFPKSELRGEGSLLQGETGRVDFEVPAPGLREAAFRSEVVDLETGRRLIPPGAGPRRSAPRGR